jgi:hypothetical protein
MKQIYLRWTAATTFMMLLTCLGARVTLAQATNTGTVVGTVTDQSGAVIPGANITLSDVTSNNTRATVSNGTGQYVFIDVSPGTYNIVAGRSGFELTKVASQVVRVGEQSTVNIKLRVGNERQTIEVSAEGVQLQTLNSTVGATINEEAIDALPSLLHDAGTFTELQAGVSPDGSVAGAVVDQSTFMLDGGNNTNDMDGSMSVYTPSFAGDPTGGAGGQSSSGNLAPGPTGVIPTPQDSVEEFKVNTANQAADFNSSAGAQVEMVTKRGTDKIHGTAYEYYLDNNFNANSWSNNLSGTPNPSFHYSKFGAGAGGPLTPKILGGKTYVFGLYQGWRFPQATTFNRAVPSPSLLAGIITDPSTGKTYDMKAIDPRGVGINPTVLAMWQKYEPPGNATSCPDLLGKYCDTLNTVEFKANMQIPESDNFLVGRIDHAFGDKWQWMASYRFYRLTRATGNQVDTGGFFPGDKLGTPTAVAPRPQQPWYLVSGLTTQITQRLTNDFHFSFLRNYWSWSDQGAPPQAAGLGGALEPMGEGASISGTLAPFNVNTQSIRTRFWDGHDTFLRDDMTYLRGKHLLQFGGQFEHNWDYHQRTDNGGGINNTPTYQLGDGSGAGLINLGDLMGGFPAGSISVARVAAAAYGMVTDSQVAYTRSGSNLALNPPLSPAFDKSSINFYNVYFGDSWKIKPTITLTYGMGWTLELPPTEATGKQDVLVDDSNEPINTLSYLHQRQVAAQQGSVYNPELGFALVGNVGNGQKYPYNPFYGSFSPRVAAAWNPKFDAGSLFGHVFGSEGTVIRGGYGRQYGRLNGVDQVLVPLLGVGLIQAVQCRQVLASGNCGPANPTASTAFRVGVDGNTAPLAAASPTLPQPVFPGFNAIAGAAAEALDPQFRPNVIDSFDLTIQRQVGHGTILEVGYIGRRIQHEYQPINLNAVPYMTVSGTQNFAQAYAGLQKALGCATSAGGCGASVPSAKTNGAPNPAYATFVNNLATSNAQGFFQSALMPGYCNGTMSNGSGVAYANCTAAVIDNELGNLLSQSVWSLWSDLDAGNFNFPRTMMNTAISSSPTFGGSGQSTSGIAENASIGYGNYNGGFFSLKTSNWHGMTMQHNFTWSKALGTGAVVQASSEITANDPFDLRKMYGVQAFNRKFVYNMFVVAREPWFANQAGLAGRFLGGWQLAPIFTAGSGGPLYCQTQTDAQSFGSADGANYFDNEECVFNSKPSGVPSSHYGVAGGTDPNGISVGTAVASNASGTPVPINMFKDPVAVWNNVRPAILGIDEKDSGLGPITGMPYWNMDLSVSKNFKIAERFSFEYSMIFTNVLNHTVLADPSLALYQPSAWGVISTNTNNPRSMEFGLRLRY